LEPRGGVVNTQMLRVRNFYKPLLTAFHLCGRCFGSLLFLPRAAGRLIDGDDRANGGRCDRRRRASSLFTSKIPTSSGHATFGGGGRGSETPAPAHRKSMGAAASPRGRFAGESQSWCASRWPEISRSTTAARRTAPALPTVPDFSPCAISLKGRRSPRITSFCRSSDRPSRKRGAPLSRRVRASTGDFCRDTVFPSSQRTWPIRIRPVRAGLSFTAKIPMIAG
jgi:hypothetical protein